MFACRRNPGDHVRWATRAAAGADAGLAGTSGGFIAPACARLSGSESTARGNTITLCNFDSLDIEMHPVRNN